MPQIIKIKGKKSQPLPPRMYMGFQLDKKDMYNGKPLQHWLDMADELVMSAIVRGINPDKNSLVQTVAAERLKGLAMVVSPNLYYKLTEERDRCRQNVGLMVGNMLGWERQPTFCAAHAPHKMSKKNKAKLATARKSMRKKRK